MQQAPCRLSQTIWTAFKAARPVCTRAHFPPQSQLKGQALPLQSWTTRSVRPSSLHVRFFSDEKGRGSSLEDAGNSVSNKLGEAVSSSRLNARTKGEEEDAAAPTVIHIGPTDDSSIAQIKSQPQPESEQPPNETVLSDAKPTIDSSTAATSPLPSERAAADASSLQARFASYMDNIQSYVFTASQRLNDLTGYSSIQSLKDSIAEQETEVAEARVAVKASRARYAEAIQTRSEIQREVNDLLHRKHSWTPEDVEKFTRLYRSDHANEQAENNAAQAVSNAEQAYEEASTRLGRSILARYHEEQIWSDKIRQMSTWGTWGLMGINILLFIILQVLLEPWRRRRLVRGFEEKVEAVLQRREGEMRAAAVPAVVEAVPSESSSSAAAAETPTTETTAAITSTETAETAEAIATTTTTAASSSAAAATTTTEDVADQTQTQTLTAISDTPEDAPSEAGTVPSPSAPSISLSDDSSAPPSPLSQLYASSTYQALRDAATRVYTRSEAAAKELLSEQPLVVSQKALTKLALEAAAAGAVVTGLVTGLVVLLTRR